MAKKRKYETLAEIKEAYESVELNSIDSPLVIDNDCSAVYVEDEEGRYVKVFEGGGPEDLLGEALDLLGIPHRGA
jgi:hypothetical protein